MTHTGERNPMWKGAHVGYRALHHWVIRQKGKAMSCEKCGKQKTTPKSIQWANVSKEYRRDVTDWVALCVPCHRAADMTEKWHRSLLENLQKARKKAAQ